MNKLSKILLIIIVILIIALGYMIHSYKQMENTAKENLKIVSETRDYYYLLLHPDATMDRDYDNFD